AMMSQRARRPAAVPDGAWPVTLVDGRVAARPLRLRDGWRWIEVRRDSADWLAPWEVTPPGRAAPETPTVGSWLATLARLRDDARAGTALPFAVAYDGRFVGQLTVGALGHEPR